MTLQQVADLREEGEALFELLDTLTDDQWALPTPFKNRTVNWVVRHLHDADRWAVQSIRDPDAYRTWAVKWIASRRIHPRYPRGRPLLERWCADFVKLCATLELADPERRVPWFGPDMGIRMMATARQMETWAHGQDIYDLVRVRRQNTDRIRNICHLGVRTFGWTFMNRELEVPTPATVRAPRRALGGGLGVERPLRRELRHGIRRRVRACRNAGKEHRRLQSHRRRRHRERVDEHGPMLCRRTPETARAGRKSLVTRRRQL